MKKRKLLIQGFILAIFAILAMIAWLYDLQIVKFVEGFRIMPLDYFFLAVYFSSSVLIILVFLITVFIYKETKRKWIFPIISSVLITSILSFILKALIKRPRPFSDSSIKVLIVAFYFIKNNFNSWNFSFPSFDAMLVFSVYPIISKEFRKFRYLWLVFAFLVAFSRVYFGVHYLSDVIIGGVIGYLIGLAMVLLEEKYSFGLKLMKKIKLHS